jgi:hypothetical protein
MGLVLERLDEVAAEANGHRGARQPVRLELLQVIQQGLELLSVLRHRLVGPFWAWARDRDPPHSLPQRRRRVVEVEPPLLLADGVVVERLVNVL